MKRLLIVFSLLCASAAQAQIKTITGGGFQRPDGTACSGCTLFLQLSNDATVSGTGQIIRGIPKTYILDASGNVPASSTIWGNDQLTPTNTYYAAALVFPGGGTVWGPIAWNLIGASPINLAQVIAVNPSPIGIPNPALLGANNAFTGNNSSSGTWTFTGPLVNTGTDSGNQTISGNKTFTGLMLCKNLAQIRCVSSSTAGVNDQGYTGTEWGTWITQALATCPVSGGYVQCQIWLGNSAVTSTWSTTVTISSPFVSIIGQGAQVSSFTCSVNGDCIRLNTSPFSVQQAGVFSNFSLTGTGTASGVGIHAGDIVGVRFQDMILAGFTGTTGVGIRLDNVTNQTERTQFNSVWLTNNTIGLRFTVGAGTTSFAYGRALDLRVNTSAANQVGISAENAANLAGNTIFAIINGNAATQTGIQFLGTSTNNIPMLLHIQEDFGGTAAVGVSTVAGTSIDAGSGSAIEMTSPMTTSILGTWNGPLPLIQPMSSRPIVDYSDNNGQGIRILRAGIDNRIFNSATVGFVGTQSANDFGITTNAIQRWTFQSAGHFIPFVDNTYDIGTTLLRPRNIFVATGVTIAGNPATVTIGSGSVALGTASIAATSCAAAVTVASANVLQADTITWSFPGAPTGGYTAGLFIQPYATAGNVNFLVCNPTAGAIVPPASNLNWRVMR